MHGGRDTVVIGRRLSPHWEQRLPSLASPVSAALQCGAFYHKSGKESLATSGWGGIRRCRTAEVYFHQHNQLAFLMNICSADRMRQIISAKLKLHTTPEQFRAL